MPLTRRQQIGQILREGPIDVEDLARRVKAPVPTVLEDFAHVRRGLPGGEVWIQHAAECFACGFCFRNRERFNTPSRCPECRSEEIRPREFELASRAPSPQRVESE